MPRLSYVRLIMTKNKLVEDVLRINKLTTSVLAVLLVGAVALGSSAVLAEDQIPAARAAFATNNVYAASISKTAADTEWTTVLESQIKTGTPKDLTIDVSAETALITSAKLSGTTGSEAVAGIEIQVLVDGNVAAPGAITFDNRLLRITGDLTHHYGGFALQIDDHWIEIYLSTKAAHAFNFAVQDLGAGVHTISVQARLTKSATADLAYADAAIGNISMVVDEAMFKTVN